jgi:hypothetical protein
MSTKEMNRERLQISELLREEYKEAIGAITYDADSAVPFFIEDIRRYVEHLEHIARANVSITKNDWISVNERLPEGDGQIVLASDGRGIVGATYFHLGKRFHFYHPHMESVTHWQPLPPLPQEPTE